MSETTFSHAVAAAGRNGAGHGVRRRMAATYLSGHGIVPGLLLASSVAAVAYALHGGVPGLRNFSTLILAILLGMALRNTVGTPAAARPGVTFSLRYVLRTAIILLGLQLTAAQVAEVGGLGFAVIVAALVSTFAFTTWLGRRIGVDRKLSELIAAGTSICGASAVIATNTVTEGSDEDVAYAVACVTVFGSLSMFLYPAFPALLHLDPHAYGLWAGASIHEIAQVVAAAFQNGKTAGDFGTIAKLSRVMLLAPVVVVLGFLAAGRRARDGSGRQPGAARRRAPLPLFVFGFIALIGVNSLGVIGPGVKEAAIPATTFLLTVALAAMGLETDIRKLKAKGVRPLALGAAAWLFISAVSLALIEIVY
ncbi:MAG TPA: YeiH family protein [Stellaceae bacterium]|jgi:uncharacterized integral membrane protein (TIGR00698 family)